MPIATAQDYEQALSLVRGVIHQWDPYSLLAGGAPDDEFDHQIAQLVARSRTMRSTADAVRAVSEVFSSSFGAADFPLDACKSVGQRLFEALFGADLLPASPRDEGAV